MEDGGAEIARRATQLFFRLITWTWPEFFGRERRQRCCLHDATGETHGIDCDADIVFGRQVIQRDGRRLGGVTRGDAHAATAGRAQIAYRGRDGRKVVQGRTEFVQTQRLHMPFDIGYVA